ncbi:alpha/beta hydrolase [Danxiaibacter flavus]|uniref:Alpha/beta hydrolase n=1 Tax=Danxiaibacter flavus TaxID=3049108 RepID=A0ABV3ZJ21_9BACT|nr:alpha/beta hydrolase [Chitinophagaceae bacterium DXS]
MKNNIVKNFIVLILLGLSIVSCKKDNFPGSGPDKGITDYHQNAVTQFIAAGKTNFAYRILGKQTGIPLVMVSALGNSMDDWDPVITNGLAQQYKVIIFDIQGVGSSSGVTPDNIPDMAKGVVTFIQALGYTKVNLLGFSMGSFITQQIASANPALVNKIILTGTGPKGAEGLSNLPNILATTVGLTPEQVFLASFFAPSEGSQTAGKLSYERIQKRTVNRDAPVSQESATAGLKAVLGWAQPDPTALEELKKLTKPVLIAQGEKDFLVPVVNAINMANSIPGSQLIVYHDAAHGAIYQYHDEFIRAASEFLTK